MEKQPILEVNNLSKTYHGAKALDNISFVLNPGEIIGFLGPNGAGKTTTINMILGILEPTSGSIMMLGKQLDKSRSESLSYMNFSAVYAQLPGNMTVYENLYVFGKLYGVHDIKRRVDVLIEEFDLAKFRGSKAGTLSSGEASRLSLAKALINEPCLLLLDEPTASLDPNVAQIFRERIRKYVNETGASVLWTSHNMQEIEKVCDQVHFLSHGQIVLSGDPKELPAAYGKVDLEELFISVAREPLGLHNE